MKSRYKCYVCFLLLRKTFRGEDENGLWGKRRGLSGEELQEEVCNLAAGLCVCPVCMWDDEGRA